MSLCLIFFHWPQPHFFPFLQFWCPHGTPPIFSLLRLFSPARRFNFLVIYMVSNGGVLPLWTLATIIGILEWVKKQQRFVEIGLSKCAEIIMEIVKNPVIFLLKMEVIQRWKVISFSIWVSSDGPFAWVFHLFSNLKVLNWLEIVTNLDTGKWQQSQWCRLAIIFGGRLHTTGIAKYK